MIKADFDLNNTSMKLIEELQKIGLSDKEARVYIAALESTEASVQNIAKKAGVNRATTYLVLDSLTKKGLVSKYDQDKKTYFVASNPEFLTGLFQIQKKEIDEREQYFKTILPELHNIHGKTGDEPVVRFFEGKQGLLNCADEFFSEIQPSQETVKMVYSKDHLDRVFSDKEREKSKKTRLNKNVKSQVIYNSSMGEIASTKDGNRQKVSTQEYPFSSDIALYGDYIRIISLGKKLSAILIKDEEIAKTLKSIFQLAWEGAKAKGKVNKS